LEVEMAEEVLQVPLAQEFVALGVVAQRGCLLALEGVVVVERVGVAGYDLLGHLVLVRAAVTADAGGSP
jgi:hypothetical protein